MFTGFEPSFLSIKVPASFASQLFGEDQLFGMIENNVWNEILGMIIIISSLMVAFSREKNEDEYILKIRLISLVWAVYLNYGILLIAILFVYNLSFLNVMTLNIFTVLFFFIIRFNWQLNRLNKSLENEK